MPIRARHVAVAVLSVGCLVGCGGSQEEPPSASDTTSTTTPTSTGRLEPSSVSYLGAFRLPGGEDRPASFAYGGSAMTFNPDGAGGAGSLFISGHDRLAYGELPNGSQVAEVTIPTPVVANGLSGLPRADFIQGFHEVAGNLFQGLDEIPRLGMLYLNQSGVGPRIHLNWGQHLQDPHATHALFSPTLDRPAPQGPWWVGPASLSVYSLTGYLIELPAAWASANTSDRMIGTGRFRDGGWSGKGPALLAYTPYSNGSLPAAGARLPATTLLLYASSEDDAAPTHHSMSGYQHPDEWEGGAWVTTASGHSALVFVGTKSEGTKYWYGWQHPGGTNLPCVETELVSQFTTCWTEEGTPCGPADLTGCSGHNDYRGWWTTRFAAQMVFYDPADLARVAAGTTASYEPQPYASLDFDQHLFHNPSGVERDMLGQGVQRRYRIGESAYDRRGNRLYVLELFADGTKPVVHVFSMGA